MQTTVTKSATESFASINTTDIKANFITEVSFEDNVASTPPVAPELVDGFHDKSLLSEKANQALAKYVTGVNCALFELERLELSCKNWEAVELAASHKRLYSLLTDCYSYYLKMKTSAQESVREDLARGLQAFIDSRGYGTNSKTHDMNKVVMSVFGGNNRRRVSAYSSALRVALTAGPLNDKNRPTPIKAEILAEWITAQGGIEEVRSSSNKDNNSGLSAEERTEVAKAALSSKVLMSLQLDHSKFPLGVDDTDKTVLLVATYRVTGNLDVCGVVKNEDAVSTALRCYYNENKEAMKGIQIEASQQHDDEVLQSAIDEAVRVIANSSNKTDM